MLKKLDILIIRAFVGPFIATFFITLLVLVMQFFWLYIDDFVGKGLDAGTILEFIWYQSAVLVPLALPLAVLLSSLMTFGNLGESFELVAIKSAGISLLRFMRPLFLVTIVICGVAFLFSNYIIPVANLKARTMLFDIVNSKPAFDLREGIFYDKIENLAIKVGKKEGDSIIRDVVIYEKGNNNLQDNFIVAKSGVMRVGQSKRYLEFNLKDGWRYEERGNRISTDNEYIRMGFKEYKKQLDLSSFQINWTNDSVNRNNERMLSMRQLDHSIDSLEVKKDDVLKRMDREVLANFAFVRYLDSTGWDTIKARLPAHVTRFEELVPDSLKSRVLYTQVSQVSSARINDDIILNDYEARQKDLRRHRIEWHRKISLSFACLVLFMIGAPLGSIIRKGGLGTPLIFAIVFFMLFYFSSTTGEKFAKEGTLSALTGMWMSTMVLLPIGIFLTVKAMRDSSLFNQEFYFRLARDARRLWNNLAGRRKKTGGSSDLVEKTPH